MAGLTRRLLSVHRSVLAPLVRNIWSGSVSSPVPLFQRVSLTQQQFPAVFSRYFSSQLLSPPCCHLNTSLLSSPSMLGGTFPLFQPPVRHKHLILIRRSKMKKHKKRKLAKRMRYVWAKSKHQKLVAREKAFQAEQFAVIAEARAFDARHYVDTLLEQHSTAPLSTIYRGRRLPYFCAVQKLPKYKPLESNESKTKD